MAAGGWCSTTAIRCAGSGGRALPVKTFLLIVALALFALAVWLMVRRLRAHLGSAAAVGVVTGHERRELDDTVSYHAVVAFEDDRHESRQFTAVAGLPRPVPRVGARVRVCYLRGQPEVAFIDSFLHMWAAPVGVAALSLGVLLVWRGL